MDAAREADADWLAETELATDWERDWLAERELARDALNVSDVRLEGKKLTRRTQKRTPRGRQRLTGT